MWELRRAASIFGILALALLLAAGGATIQAPRPPASPVGSISSAEFSRLIQDFSEPGGYFFSDNFTSNESAYLYIMKPLEKYGSTGGAYVGVGPEQNFTYIAHIRPEIAFIVDIRRQAIIQHLMYKAIFHLASDRAQFLSILFSKPLLGPRAPKRNSSIEEILNYFDTAHSSQEAFRTNLARLERVIRQDFQFPITRSDHTDLAYVFDSFYKGDLKISFRMAGDNYGGYWGQRFPNLADLILATDQSGNMGNFLVQ